MNRRRDARSAQRRSRPQVGHRPAFEICGSQHGAPCFRGNAVLPTGRRRRPAIGGHVGPGCLRIARRGRWTVRRPAFIQARVPPPAGASRVVFCAGKVGLCVSEAANAALAAGSWRQLLDPADQPGLAVGERSAGGRGPVAGEVAPNSSRASPRGPRVWWGDPAAGRRRVDRRSRHLRPSRRGRTGDQSSRSTREQTRVAAGGIFRRRDQASWLQQTEET